MVQEVYRKERRRMGQRETQTLFIRHDLMKGIKINWQFELE